MASASSPLKPSPPPSHSQVTPDFDLNLPPLPHIKQEIEATEATSDEELDSDSDLEGSGLVKPAIENILSSSEESEESEEVSEFEEDEEENIHSQNGQNANESSPQRHFGSQNTTRSTSGTAIGAGGIPGLYLGDVSPSKFDKFENFPNGEPNRRKREAFTLQQKLEVLKFLESHSVNATSRFYKVDPKSIRLWRSQKNKIELTVQEELLALQEAGDSDAVTPRKRISGAGRKKRDKLIVEIEESPSKRHRRSIKLSDKVEIIRLIENGQTQSDVARSLGISQSTVQTIWSNKQDILERNQTPKKKRKNLHWKKYSTIDSALFNWYRQCRDTGVPIDGKMLVEKASEFAEYFKQPEFKQQAQRWIDMFKKRHSITDIDRQERLQAAAANLSSAVGLEHQHQQHLHHQQHQMHQTVNHSHDLVPDFDLSSLPSLMAGLYPPDPTNPTGIPPPSAPPLPPPNFNPHIPLVLTMPVTTCDAMKYIELTRNWIASTFGEGEETLNNHLNAVENAILKRRMTEMLAPVNR